MLRFEFGNVLADFARGEVTRHGVKVNLASKEIQLLRFLIDHRGQLVSREQLLRSIWSQQPYITPHTVHSCPQPRHILTVRGEGYRFER